MGGINSSASRRNGQELHRARLQGEVEELKVGAAQNETGQNETAPAPAPDLIWRRCSSNRSNAREDLVEKRFLRSPPSLSRWAGDGAPRWRAAAACCSFCSCARESPRRPGFPTKPARRRRAPATRPRRPRSSSANHQGCLKRAPAPAPSASPASELPVVTCRPTIFRGRILLQSAT
jgi:hypothetical protein